LHIQNTFSRWVSRRRFIEKENRKDNAKSKNNPKTFLWIAGGTGATYNLVYSTNGINWTGSTTGTSLITNKVNAIGCNDSIWVASGLLTDNSSIMIYSFDGISWIKFGNDIITILKLIIE
jgi:hypothetical protein